MTQFNFELLCQLYYTGRRLQADREHDHVKILIFNAAIFGHVAKLQVIRIGHRVNGVHSTAHETHALFQCPVVVLLKLLATGAHVHEKDGAIKPVPAVLLGNDCFLYRIHTTYARAVTIITAVDVS